MAPLVAFRCSLITMIIILFFCMLRKIYWWWWWSNYLLLEVHVPVTSEMKSYYGGPIGTHQRSFDRYHPGPLRPPLPQDWGSQYQPKTAIAIISGTGKATDCKFGRYIHRVHPNKCPLKISEKRSVGVSRNCPHFLSTPYYLRNG